jgi:hypothetical protein
MPSSLVSAPSFRRSALPGDAHRQLHWAAIRSVCRNRDLAPHTRRAKLRFLVEGLARSAGWPAPRPHAAMMAR